MVRLRDELQFAKLHQRVPHRDYASHPASLSTMRTVDRRVAKRYYVCDISVNFIRGAEAGLNPANRSNILRGVRRRFQWAYY